MMLRLLGSLMLSCAFAALIANFQCTQVDAEEHQDGPLFFPGTRPTPWDAEDGRHQPLYNLTGYMLCDKPDPRVGRRWDHLGEQWAKQFGLASGNSDIDSGFGGNAIVRWDFGPFHFSGFARGDYRKLIVSDYRIIMGKSETVDIVYFCGNVQSTFADFKATDHVTMYLTSLSGTLRKAVTTKGYRTAEVLPDSIAEEGFEAEKAYWSGELAAELSRVSRNPSDNGTCPPKPLDALHSH
jgi:hypothetical protein